MEVLNKTERRKSFLFFLVFFGLTMGLLLIAVFFNVAFPFVENQLLKKENQKMKQEMEIQNRFSFQLEQVKGAVDSIGIAGQNIISRSHSDYIIREDPDKLIDFEDLERLKNRVDSIPLSPGQEIIHALPQDYKVDNNLDVKEPIGMMGSRLDATFHLVIGQVNAIRAISRCVVMAHLKPVGLTLEPIASASAVSVAGDQ